MNNKYVVIALVAIIVLAVVYRTAMGRKYILGLAA